ncbi:MAG TPA: PP2C family protein-serine/threonine phosphatase [Acidobacteriaceae bacterium]|nr:PP2C family protein-serine/threonine phosphatase [Acidobacteriaceae bacterium]
MTKRVMLSVLLLLFISPQIHGLEKSEPATPPAPPSAMQVSFGQSVIDVSGPWKFSVGDDPAWSDPDYSDSAWENVNLAPASGSYDPITGWSGYVPGWSVLGHPDYWGYAWYRIRLQVNVHRGEVLALAGPTNVDDAYQIYANGNLIGSFGNFPSGSGTPTTYYSQPAMFRLPPAQVDGPENLLLAFRVWMAPGTLDASPLAGGLHSPPLLGEVSTISAEYHLAHLRLIRTYIFGLLIAGLFFLLAVMASSLLLFDRDDPVYRWLIAVFLLTSVWSGGACISSWTQIVSITTSSLFLNALLQPLILGAWIMVWWAWFRLREPWVPKFIALLTVCYILTNAIGEDIFFAFVPHPITSFFRLASVGIRILFLLPLIFIVIVGVSKQGWEGLLALPAVILVGVAQFQTELAVLGFRVFWFPLGVRIGLDQIAYLTLAVAIFILLLRRLRLSMQVQRELESDVQQAHEVQKVLIPATLPQVPGLILESEYFPAKEVGGDFFQILPNRKDGSALIIAGDVTGHGLRSGMVGALLVGATRSEGSYSRDPLTILNALNSRLAGQGQATCLVMRIDADGHCALANAGHPPPYVNGKELPVEGAVPLGMFPNAEFSSMEFELNPGDRLMMLSDGVSEARSETGELFGFDRIHRILDKPISARDVAETARQFGQEDDISVLSIVRDKYIMFSKSGRIMSSMH